VVQNTTASPIFKKLTYIQGGTNVGSTQYVDAFQRASLWGTVSAHPTYHVLLGKPVIKPLQSLRVPAADGSVGNPFGTKLLIASINWFDPLAAGMISSLGIPAGALPIFVTTQTYLSNNSGLSGCCIGGYHNVSGAGQPYAMFTYIQTPGQFSQDVSALSHEIGEYVNDPFTNNINVPASCFTNLIYEVGEPARERGELRRLPVCPQRVHVSPSGPGDTGVLRGTRFHQRARLEHLPGNQSSRLPERRVTTPRGQSSTAAGSTTWNSVP